jgi:hypothetical protein
MLLAMPSPVAGERESLIEYLKYQHTALFAAAYGLTDEQARCTPSVSPLCIGGLIKHVTTLQYAWTQQAALGKVLAPAEDSRSLTGMMLDLAEQHTFHDDETLDGLLGTYREQNAETLRVFAEAQLDATIVVPDHLQGLYDDPHWTARWVLLHLIEELARHAGHADIIRESIDGATMYQLLVALEGG